MFPQTNLRVTDPYWSVLVLQGSWSCRWTKTHTSAWVWRGNHRSTSASQQGDTVGGGVPHSLVLREPLSGEPVDQRSGWECSELVLQAGITGVWLGLVVMVILMEGRIV